MIKAYLFLNVLACYFDLDLACSMLLLFVTVHLFLSDHSFGLCLNFVCLFIIGHFLTECFAGHIDIAGKSGNSATAAHGQLLGEHQQQLRCREIYLLPNWSVIRGFSLQSLLYLPSQKTRVDMEKVNRFFICISALSCFSSHLHSLLT